MLLACSELLREDEEPFEVLPGACIGPSLFVALHVLLAEEPDFKAWRSLEDALAQLQRSCRPASGAPGEAVERVPGHGVCAARVAAQGHGVKWQRAVGTECGRESCNGQHCCGGDGRRGTEGRPQNTAKRRVVEAHGAENAHRDIRAAAAERCLGDKAEEQPDQAAEDGAWRPGVTGISGAPLGARTRGVLGACIRERLAQYRLPGLAQERRMLAQEERRAKGSRSGEAARARLAALRLVVTEKRVLLNALAALGDS